MFETVNKLNIFFLNKNSVYKEKSRKITLLLKNKEDTKEFIFRNGNMKKVKVIKKKNHLLKKILLIIQTNKKKKIKRKKKKKTMKKKKKKMKNYLIT